MMALNGGDTSSWTYEAFVDNTSDDKYVFISKAYIQRSPFSAVQTQKCMSIAERVGVAKSNIDSRVVAENIHAPDSQQSIQQPVKTLPAAVENGSAAVVHSKENCRTVMVCVGLTVNASNSAGTVSHSAAETGVCPVASQADVQLDVISSQGTRTLNSQVGLNDDQFTGTPTVELPDICNTYQVAVEHIPSPTLQSPNDSKSLVESDPRSVGSVPVVMVTDESSLVISLSDVEQDQLRHVEHNIDELNTWITAALADLCAQSGIDGFVPSSVIDNYTAALVTKRQALEQSSVVLKESLRPDVQQLSDVCDVRCRLVDVHSVLHHLSDTLSRLASDAAVRVIERDEQFLVMVESRINSGADIVTDPEQLLTKLSEEEGHYRELLEKCQQIESSSRKLTRSVRSAAITARPTDVDHRLDAVATEASQLYSKLQKRLERLEEASFLAVDFQLMHRDLGSTLSEVECQLNAVDTSCCGDIGLLQRQLHQTKTSCGQLTDLSTLVNDVFDYGTELSALTGCQQIAVTANELRRWFECLRKNAHNKTVQVTESLHEAASQAAEVVSSCRDCLHSISDQLDTVDDLPCCLADADRQIAETEVLAGDLQCCTETLRRIHSSVMLTSDDQDAVNDTDADRDAADKPDMVEELTSSLTDAIQTRLDQLTKVKYAARQYEEAYNAAKLALEDVENSVSGGGTSSDGTLYTMSRCDQLVADCHQKSQVLQNACDNSTEFARVSKELSDLSSLSDDVRLSVDTHRADHQLNTYYTDNYHNLLQTINDWLSAAEKQMTTFDTVAADQRSVRIQIEQLKAFTRQLYPRCCEVEKLAYSADMVSSKSGDAKAITEVVADISRRWNDVVTKAAARERCLSDTVVELGEVDQALDDVLGLLHEVETDLLNLDVVAGDPNCCEAFASKVQMLQKCLSNQKSVINKLNLKVQEAVSRSGQSKSPLSSKLSDVNDAYKQVSCLAQQRHNEILDKLHEVRTFMLSVDELRQWMADYSKQLRMVKMPGALPQSAQAEFDKFMGRQLLLQDKLDEVKVVMLNGDEMKSRCGDDEAIELSNKLLQLHRQTCSTVAKSNALQRNFEEHLQNVMRFHATLDVHVQWLGDTETALGGLRHPSKLVDKVEKQIADHKTLQDNVTSHQAMAKGLDTSGTYIKYFGGRRDLSAVQSRLFDSKLRWKRLRVRTHEKGRHLQQAYRQSREFYVYWSSLRDWLDDASQQLKVPTTDFTTLQLEQLALKLLELEHQQDGKYPTYYMALRRGRDLLSRCAAGDSERASLSDMVDELKTKWFRFKTALLEKQGEVRDAQLSLQQTSTVAFGVGESLLRVENCLSSRRPPSPDDDYDAVCTLIDQHAIDEREHETLERVVNTLAGCSELDADTKSKLTTTCRRVSELAADRASLLRRCLLDAKLQNFHMSAWKRRYLEWIRRKKFSSVELFRRHNDVLTRKQFIDGLLATKFPTNEAELNAVFDIVDKKRMGKISYQQFISVLRNDQSLMRASTESVKIHDIIQQQLSLCTCRQKYLIQQVADGKYRFGDKGKLYLVRFLNSSVMVRVGGGWETLPKFLESNDPCRARGRTNTELRENFVLPDGVSQARVNFVPRRSSLSPSATPVSIARASSADDILGGRRSTSKQRSGDVISAGSRKTSRPRLQPSSGRLTPTAAYHSADSAGSLDTPPSARTSPRLSGSRSPASLTPSSCRSLSPATVASSIRRPRQKKI